LLAWFLPRVIADFINLTASASRFFFRMGQPRLGLQMLYFHQVGVGPPTLDFLGGQSITKLRELVSIGPRTGEIALLRAQPIALAK